MSADMMELDLSTVTRRIEALPDKQKETLATLTALLVTVMESEDGCAVLMADTYGDGTAGLMIVGNSMIAPQLVFCVADIMKKLEKPIGGMQ